MGYDFDTIIDRYGTNSIKYEFAVEKKKLPVMVFLVIPNLKTVITRLLLIGLVRASGLV